MSKKISLFSLVFLIVAAIDSIRNLPAAALFGSSLIFFYLLAAAMFLIPVTLLSSEFSSRYPEEGGIFHWVRHAFGEKMGLLAIWLQWINTMIWYPTILAFLAGTAAYLFDPDLAQSKVFLGSVILIVFWGLTCLNLLGLQVSVKINSICSIIGTLFPMMLLIGLGIAWILSGHPVQILFDWQSVVPTLSSERNWVSLIIIMASFVGMELAGVHVKEVANPRRNFPRALGISIFILLFTMIFGSLSIASVIPEKEIRLVDGIMQTMTHFLEAFHVPASGRFLALLIIIGTFGGMINWLIAPAKGLFHAAQYGFLPRYFTLKNNRGVPVRILFTQAVLVSIFCFCFTLMPSINAFYWFLTAISTEMYTIMYVLMFAAALKLGRPSRGLSVFWIPRGIRHLSCVLGLISCILTIIVGFFPPNEIDVGGEMRYVLLIAAGNVLVLIPAGLLCFYKSLASIKENKKLGRR